MHNRTTRGSSEAHAHTRACTNECRTANEAQSRREREEGDQLPALPHDDALAQGRGVTREGGREGGKEAKAHHASLLRPLSERKERENKYANIHLFIRDGPSVCLFVPGGTDRQLEWRTIT